MIPKTGDSLLVELMDEREVSTNIDNDSTDGEKLDDVDDTTSSWFTSPHTLCHEHKMCGHIELGSFEDHETIHVHGVQPYGNWFCSLGSPLSVLCVEILILF